MKQLYTTKELALLLKVHENTIFNWRKNGLPFQKFGTSVRFDAEEVSDWLQSKDISEKIK